MDDDALLLLGAALIAGAWYVHHNATTNPEIDTSGDDAADSEAPVSGVDNRLNSLDPSFQGAAQQLVDACNVDSIPVRVFETRRSIERQAAAAGSGHSNRTGANAPHVKGMALDFVLIPELIPGCTGLWDTVTPGAKDAWAQLGAAAEALGLEWGGRWTKPYDPGHCQQRGA
ncbi:MAG: M15 family metallopeptidase [Candidatus Saccharibacteria bacterium]